MGRQARLRARGRTGGNGGERSEARVGLGGAPRLGDASGVSAAALFTHTPPPSRQDQARAAAERGDLNAALALYGALIQGGDTSPDVINDFGALLARSGQLVPAIVQFEMALAINPSHPNARPNLLAALESLAVDAFHRGRWKDAAAAYGRLIELVPDSALFHSNAGAALLELREPQLALAYLRKAADLNPDAANIQYNLGSTLLELEDRGAQAALERTVALDPNHVDAHVNLALVYEKLGRLELAEATLRRALALRPDHGEAHGNLGTLLRQRRALPESLAHFRRAMELRPQSPVIAGSYLLARQADPTATAEELWQEHRSFGERFAAPLDPGPTCGFAARDHDPERRLRVGYVSADFRRHSVAFFMEPLIEGHDRRSFEVFCYSDTMPDEISARLKGFADRWRDTRTLDDARLASQIVADRIDVLVDLSGHTAGNRLLAFARRPAPVQVTYCGYPGTTGLASIGWRLTDAVADPEGEADRHHSERLWRLPQGFLCYRPDADAPQPSQPPSRGSEIITFGSFNNLAKLNDDVLALWAEILRATPRSRLLFKARGIEASVPAEDGAPESSSSPQASIRRFFVERGLAPERIVFAPYAETTADHLSAYSLVDVALDPFPYGGTTTTCEALWMGVPVITLVGQTHAGRVGASLLHRVGLDDLMARDRQDYVARAIALAGDGARLAALRAELRPTMAASSLTSAQTLARDVEAAYRAMWRDRCAKAA